MFWRVVLLSGKIHTFNLVKIRRGPTGRTACNGQHHRMRCNNLPRHVAASCSPSSILNTIRGILFPKQRSNLIHTCSEVFLESISNEYSSRSVVNGHSKTFAKTTTPYIIYLHFSAPHTRLLNKKATPTKNQAALKAQSRSSSTYAFAPFEREREREGGGMETESESYRWTMGNIHTHQVSAKYEEPESCGLFFATVSPYTWRRMVAMCWPARYKLHRHT